MQSFYQMSCLLENFETLQEAGGAVDDLIQNRIAADAPKELLPYIKQIIAKGWRGGMHSIDSLDAPGVQPELMMNALNYLQQKGAIRFTDDDHFQVADINQFYGAGGSALKGAKVGALSRRMVQAGRDVPREKGAWSDAIWTELDDVSKKFPQYAEVFRRIMNSGGWRRLKRGVPVQAGQLYGIAKTGGNFSPDVEKFLMALMALKSEGIIFFEDQKPTLNTMVQKQAPEVDQGKEFTGPSSASDAAKAAADADARLWHANKGHGGTAQQKMTPGAMASSGEMYGDDPTQAIAREWWRGWNTAMTALDRDPTLWDNENFMNQLETNSVKALQNIAKQIKDAINKNAPRETVKPMLRNFFMIAAPKNSQVHPVSLFHDAAVLARDTKALYDGAFKGRQAKIG